jgi:hypothetical protein
MNKLISFNKIVKKVPFTCGSRATYDVSITRNSSSRASGFSHNSETNPASLRRLSSLYAQEYEEESEPDAESPAILSYVSGVEMPITSTLHITTPQEDIPSGTWPVFRLMVSSS